jgi:hypothetical protein
VHAKVLFFSSIDVVKDIIDKTSTSEGLRVFSTIKDKVYATARKVNGNFSKTGKLSLIIGKWNYRAIPQVKN